MYLNHFDAKKKKKSKTITRTRKCVNQAYFVLNFQVNALTWRAAIQIYAVSLSAAIDRSIDQ